MVIGAIVGTTLAAGASYLSKKEEAKARQEAQKSAPKGVSPVQSSGRSRVGGGGPLPPPTPTQQWGGLSPTVRRGILEMQQSVAMEALADEELREFGKPGQYNAMVGLSRSLLNPKRGGRV